MAISYNAGTNTLTLDGVNTYSLAQIYAADVAGGWGVVTNVGEMYLFMCNMIVGDAAGNATKLIDTNVGFQLGVTGTRKTFETKAGTEVKFGVSIIMFFLPAASWKTCEGYWEFKGCTIYKRGNGIGIYHIGSQYHENCYFDVSGWYCRTGTVDFSETIIDLTPESTYYRGAFYYYTTGTINDLLIRNGGACGLYVWESDPTLKDVTFVNNTVDIHLTADRHATLINCTFDNTKLEFVNAACYLLDKYEFDLTVTNEANTVIVGATVTLADKNGVARHAGTTDVNGKVGTWEVLANRYDGTSETKTEYNPFTLTISKTGYTDYETVITISEKIDWVIKIGRRQRKSTIKF